MKRCCLFIVILQHCFFLEAVGKLEKAQCNRKEDPKTGSIWVVTTLNCTLIHLQMEIATGCHTSDHKTVACVAHVLFWTNSWLTSSFFARTLKTTHIGRESLLCFPVSLTNLWVYQTPFCWKRWIHMKESLVKYKWIKSANTTLQNQNHIMSILSGN